MADVSPVSCPGSLGAVFAGLLAGSVAEVGGVTALILAQILALLGGLTSNGAAARLARQRGGHPGRKRVIQRRFNVGVLEAIPKKKASTR